MITSADGKRIEGLIYFAETHKQTKFGLLNQTVLVVRSCLFASQYLFLCAGDFSLPVCLVLSLSGHRSGLFFYLGRLMLLTVLSILAVQPKPHWPDSQMLSPLIVGTRCHSDPLLFCWPTRCTFFPGGTQLLQSQFGLLHTQTCWQAHCVLVIKRWAETHPIKAFLCRFKWCWRCVGLHRLFWLSGLLSASLCGNTLAVSDESKDE